MDMQRVALIGLGAVGSDVAQQPLKAGFPLTVYNRTAGRAAEAVKGGARLAPSPASPLVKDLSSRMAECTYDAHFALHLTRKDSTATLERFNEAIDRGWGDRYFSAVAEAACENNRQ